MSEWPLWRKPATHRLCCHLALLGLANSKPGLTNWASPSSARWHIKGKGFGYTVAPSIALLACPDQAWLVCPDQAWLVCPDQAWLVCPDLESRQARSALDGTTWHVYPPPKAVGHRQSKPRQNCSWRHSACIPTSSGTYNACNPSCINKMDLMYRILTDYAALNCTHFQIRAYFIYRYTNVFYSTDR